MKRMFDEKPTLGLDVRWEVGSRKIIAANGMFGITDKTGDVYDSGENLGSIQTDVPVKGDRVLFVPEITNNIGILLNFGRKIENTVVYMDTTDNSVVTADNCKANINVINVNRGRGDYAVGIDGSNKILICDGLGIQIKTTADIAIDINDFFVQLIKYWKSIGFTIDESDQLIIPTYALQPANTGCYIKKEFIPKSLWIRLDVNQIYQLPIVPVF